MPHKLQLQLCLNPNAPAEAATVKFENPGSGEWARPGNLRLPTWW
jgi:hypothetical protein